MILQLLRDGPLTSGEITDRFDSSWPTVSRHLAVLREAGLVVTERHGQEIRYEVNTSVFQGLIQHLHATVLAGLLGMLRGQEWAAQIVPLMLGSTMISVGNLLPRTRPHLAIGIRT